MSDSEQSNEVGVRLLIDAARRPLDAAEAVLSGIDDVVLHTSPDERGSSIAWLIWHAARQQDAQVAILADRPQVWETGAWAQRLGVRREPSEVGFGDDLGTVRSLRVASSKELLGYLRAVVEFLSDYLGELSPAQLDEVIDTSWDPPVTRGVRIVSTIDDAAQHLGQAAYVRGLLTGWTIGY